MAAYSSDVQIDAYLEHTSVGGVLPEMPLFLSPDRYINVPLASTYQLAYEGLPAFWRQILEGT